MALRRRERQRMRHYRRTAGAGLAVVGALIAVATVGGPSGAQSAPGAATPGFNKGTGYAVAQSIRLDPVAGGLSFGIGIGEALAGHQNTVASAESRAANLGLIGTTLAAEACDGGDPTLPREDQPQPLRVDSTDEGAEAGRSGSDPKVPGVDRQVRATTAPFAEAITSARNLDIPGLLSVQGSRATTTSGVEGELREAVARTDIGRVVVAGVVELRGMTWEVVHRSGSTDEQTATFSLGSLAIGGIPVPVEDPLAALSQANAVLQPLGLEIRPPRSHFDETSKGTLATVDPLGIRVIPSDLRDGIVDPILSGAQPVREAVFDALIELDCTSASVITILDVVLNAFGSGGYFAVELGGVQATTAELRLFQGLGAGGSLPPLSSTGPATGALGETLSRPPTGSGAPTGAGNPTSGNTTDTGGSEQAIDDAVDTAADLTGSRGGALAGVAGAGLLLLLATAEADRRKMRRAMREIPMEA